MCKPDRALSHLPDTVFIVLLWRVGAAQPKAASRLPVRGSSVLTVAT